MKNVLVCMVSLGLASTASAAFVRMNFVGGGNWTGDYSAQVELWVDLSPGEQVSAIGGSYAPIAGNPLELTSYTSILGSDSGMVNLGPVGAGASFGTTWDAGSELTGPGSFLVATKAVVQVSMPGAMHEIMFDYNTIDKQFTLLNAAGESYQFRPTYASAGYPGYWGFGDYGSPEVRKPNGALISPANPLFFTPEPASLTLLVLGGVAVLRRR